MWGLIAATGLAIGLSAATIALALLYGFCIGENSGMGHQEEDQCAATYGWVLVCIGLSAACWWIIAILIALPGAP